MAAAERKAGDQLVHNPEVSVIIVSYNPVWNKLENTLLSVILQKNAEMEIIIADDGSKDNLFGQAELLLKRYGAENYKFIDSAKNRGTVKNVYAALKKAKGRYVRMISPGDYMYSETTLADSIRFMKSSHARVCFGKPVYYNDDEGFRIIDHSSVPRNLFLYRNKRKENWIRRNYLELDDMPLGASFFCERKIMQRYISKIADHLVLGEDFAFNIMVFNHVKILFFDAPVVWYEFGHGVSTSGNVYHGKIMAQDWENMRKIMLDAKPGTFYDKRFQMYIRIHDRNQNKNIRRIIRYAMYPDILIWRLVRKIRNERTVTDPDYGFLERIGEKKLDNI